MGLQRAGSSILPGFFLAPDKESEDHNVRDEQSRHRNGRYKISGSELSGVDMLDPLEQRIQQIQQAYDVEYPG